MKNHDICQRGTGGFWADNLDGLLDQFPPALRGHSRRVAVCCYIMAGYAEGFTHAFGAPAVSGLQAAAHLGGTLHDIGKLLLSQAGAGKAYYLLHPAAGADFLEAYKTELFEDGGQSRHVLEAVRYHHEQPYGPGGSGKGGIPLLAGICALANRLDHQLYLKYRFYFNGESVLENIKKQAGTVFSESAVFCAERAWPGLMEHYSNWNLCRTLQKKYGLT